MVWIRDPGEGDTNQPFFNVQTMHCVTEVLRNGGVKKGGGRGEQKKVFYSALIIIDIKFIKKNVLLYNTLFFNNIFSFSKTRRSFSTLGGFFFSAFIIKLNVVLSFPARSLGFLVFKTYFIFDVTSKLRFFLNFQF